MENFKANENETILEIESCDIFPNQVFMEEESFKEIMERRRSYKHNPTLLMKKE
jgi:hypothetical protein